MLKNTKASCLPILSRGSTMAVPSAASPPHLTCERGRNPAAEPHQPSTSSQNSGGQKTGFFVVVDFTVWNKVPSIIFL